MEDRCEVNSNVKWICPHCNIERTSEGYDGCLGYIEGVIEACCGHGDFKPHWKPYAVLESGERITFNDINELKRYFNLI